MTNKFIAEMISRITPVDLSWLREAETRQLTLTKPPQSLGRLEEIACRLCAIQESIKPTASPCRIIVFAADHGVCEEGVSAYPGDVTRQMVENFLAGGAAINAIARVTGARLTVVNIGIDCEIDPAADSAKLSNVADATGVTFINAPIDRGTMNFVRSPAMTEEQLAVSIKTGFDVAKEAAREGIKLIGLGEMGIGNTTAASAITAALTGIAVEKVTGRGTGVDDKTYARKITTIKKALERNQPDSNKPLDVLRKVGGFEIAGLCGLCLGAASLRIAIIADGFITTSAAAIAARLCPALTDYLFVAHLSAEPGHQALLELLSLKPLLDLNLRLGEGTGAALAFGIMKAAAATFNEMATFASAGVANRMQS
ncbi:MAG: nicotinate-nucleotide--dimethylbenzimidazole phosphoribosyltransferase [Pyrinomonadaceae bacterium]